MPRETKVVNVAFTHRGTGHAERPLCTVLRITRDRVDLGCWIKIHACILLEIDPGCHSTTLCICTMTRGQENSWRKQRTATPPNEFAVGIVEDRQTYKGMLEVFDESPRDRIDRTHSHCQDHYD